MIEISYTTIGILTTACVFWCVHTLGVKVFDFILTVIEAALESFKDREFNLKKNLPKFIYCGKCSSFWFVLIVNWNLYDASVIAVAVFFIELVSVYLESNSKTKL